MRKSKISVPCTASSTSERCSVLRLPSSVWYQERSVSSKMNISHAFAKSIGASALIICEQEPPLQHARPGSKHNTRVSLQACGTHANFLVRLHDFFDSGKRKVVVAEVCRVLHLLPLLVPEVRQLVLQLLSAKRRLLLRVESTAAVCQRALGGRGEGQGPGGAAGRLGVAGRAGTDAPPPLPCPPSAGLFLRCKQRGGPVWSLSASPSSPQCRRRGA